MTSAAPFTISEKGKSHKDPPYLCLVRPCLDTTLEPQRLYFTDGLQSYFKHLTTCVKNASRQGQILKICKEGQMMFESRI